MDGTTGEIKADQRELGRIQAHHMTGWLPAMRCSLCEACARNRHNKHRKPHKPPGMGFSQWAIRAA